MSLSKPRCIINVDQCKRNIHQMAAKARKHNLNFRPHFKTHQSKQVGDWFRDEGVEAITVSSLDMAHYFAEAGWKDITIGMPVNLNALDEIAGLSSKIHLRILVDSAEAADALKADGRKYNFYIEIDSGANRSGLPFDKVDEIKQLIKRIKVSDNLKLIGFYSHAGHTYRARSKKEAVSIGEEAKSNFLSIKEHIAHDKLEFCFGDTPSCSLLGDFEGIDAISPGNFVFYDIMQSEIGSCQLSDIAIFNRCPVISKKHPNHLLIHGGAIHFSKDSVEYQGRQIFGLAPQLNHAPLIALSQEHGILEVTEQEFKKINLGDIIEILPIHSCLTAQSMGGYETIDGDHIDHFT